MSKIIDLFHAQQKSNITCSECKHDSVKFDTYSYLSLPIIGSNTKSFIIDIFHGLQDKQPIRHILHINKHQKVVLVSREDSYKEYSRKAIEG